MNSQSRQKYTNSAAAVPTWSTTTKGKKAGECWSTGQPNSGGTITACPRLLIGNNSVMPCRTARAKA